MYGKKLPSATPNKTLLYLRQLEAAAFTLERERLGHLLNNLNSRALRVFRFEDSPAHNQIIRARQHGFRRGHYPFLIIGGRTLVAHAGRHDHKVTLLHRRAHEMRAEGRHDVGEHALPEHRVRGRHRLPPG